MNLVLDSLKTRLSFRWSGHGLGLLAAFGLLALEGKSGFPWQALLVLAACLAAFEGAFSYFDRKTRWLKALAPTAFPFKDLAEEDRSLLQSTLLAMPSRSALRAVTVWAAGAFVLALRLQTQDAFLACAFLGLPVAAACPYLGLSAMGRRIAPFYYFEGNTADELSKSMPSLGRRFLLLAGIPLALALALPAIASFAGPSLNLDQWCWIALWALAAFWGGTRVFKDLVVAPIEDLGMALGRFGEGDYGALLDVASGDEIGVTTGRYNRSVRSTDRRFFIRENFGSSLSPAQAEGLFEGGFKLDGEERELAVVAFRLLNPQAPAEQFNRFCGVAQDLVDKHGGCLDEIGFGLMVAVFNAPLKLEAPGPKAASCAFEASAALNVLRSQQRMRHGIDLDFGVGLSAGRATAALAGPPQRQRYAVLGLPALEARDLSRRSGLHLSPAAAGALGPGFVTRQDAEGWILEGIPVIPVPENP